MAKYDVDKYQEARQKVIDAANDLETFVSSNNIQGKNVLKLIIKRAIEGSVECCKEIYKPENIEYTGSNTNYETDKKALQDLGKFFE